MTDAGAAFGADPAAVARYRTLSRRAREAVTSAVGQDGRIAGERVAALVADLGLIGPREVMLLALPAAATLADPAISGYRVGAVGRAVPSGDLLLGGNLEFPGTDLRLTIHAEGAVAIRAFGRDTAIEVLAVDEARPCAYCRQTLSEFAGAGDLRIIDPLGHDVGLSDLYPWPFTPADLGDPGIVPGAVPWPSLALAPGRLPSDVATSLVAAASRAHAPYGRGPAAVVLRLHDGRLVVGATMENVAFNPSVGPLTGAIVELRAGGDGYAAIESAYLAAPADAAVDDVRSTRDLLAVVARGVALTVVSWA